MARPPRIRGSLSDGLLDVWTLLRAGRDDDARRRLLGLWSFSADALAGDQAARVAARLLVRLAPSTDDPDGWARLPATITVYRAGTLDGFAWTTELDTADWLAREIAAANPGEPVTVHAGTAAKRDVLAYITGYGEHELVVRREHVNVSNVPVRARTVPTSVPTPAEKQAD